MNTKYRGYHIVEEKLLPVETIDYRNNIVSLNEGDNSLSDTLEMVELMMYTGLKDKSGKKVYEGDIIPYHFNEDVKGVVVYGAYRNVCDDEHAKHIGFYVKFDDEKYKNTMRKDLGYWLKVSRVEGWSRKYL